MDIQSTRWLFIMGVWERCIRTIGRVLAALLKEQRLDDAGLLTLTCEVEAIVNGRPKMKISDDPKDVNHLHQTICSCSSQPLYYLPLPSRKKAAMRNLVVSDIVLVVDEKPPRGFLPLGHFQEVYLNKSDGHVPRVKVKTMKYTLRQVELFVELHTAYGMQILRNFIYEQ